MAESWVDGVAEAAMYEIETGEKLAELDFVQRGGTFRLGVMDSLVLDLGVFRATERGAQISGGVFDMTQELSLMKPVEIAGVTPSNCPLCGSPVLMGPAMVRVKLDVVRIDYRDADGKERSGG